MFTRVKCRLLFLGSCLISQAAAACVPDFPESLLADPTVIRHPAVISAFHKVQEKLSDLFVNTTRDGLSFGVVRTARNLQVW